MRPFSRRWDAEYALAVEHDGAVDPAFALEPHPAALFAEFHDFDADVDDVADLDGTAEIQGLRDVDGAGAGKAHADDCGNQARRVEAVDDSLAETGLASEMLAEMNGIVIARQFGEADDVLVLHGLAQRL